MFETFAAMGRFGTWCLQVAWRIVSPPWEVHQVARHIWSITTRCMMPVFSVVFPFGMVIALQGLTIFELFGAQQFLSSLVSVAVFRELSPVLVAVLVAAQGGSAIAAELGAMRIKEELDATAVMGIDPLRVHVIPRVIGATVAAPLLNILGWVAGISGGYVTTVFFKGENGGVYWAYTWELTNESDLIGSLAKTVVFGLMIGLISTYQGFYATGGAAGVGKAVNDTVVIASTGSIVANYFLTSAFFGAIE